MHQPIIPVDERFKLMADTAPVMIWASGTDKQCCFLNTAWLKFRGRSLENELGFGWTEGIHPDDRDRCKQLYETSFDDRLEFKIEYRLQRQDGQYRWMAAEGSPCYDTDGAFTGYIGSAMDIDILLESERIKKEFISAEAYGKEQALNEELAATNEELSATNEELYQAQQKMMQLNSELEAKVVQRTAALEKSESDLQALNEELTATNEELAAANEELVTINEDLVKSQEQLQDTVNELEASEHRMRALVESAPFPIGVYVGREMRIQLANQSMIDVWGKGNDVIGKLYSEILPELSDQQIFSQLDQVFTTGIPFHARNQRVDIVVDNKLQPFYFNYSFTPLFDSDGKVYGVMNTGAEITDLVTARQQVERNEKLFRSIALNIPNSLIIVIDKEHRFLTIEGDLMDKMGFDRKDYEGKYAPEVVPPERYEASKPLYDRVLNGERFSIERKSERGEDFMVHMVPLKTEDGDTYAGLIIALDVSEIKRSEKQSAMLAAIIESSNDAIVGKGLDSVITSWNDAARRLFGYNEEEMIGESILKIIPPERHHEEIEIISKISNGERIEHFETQRLTKDNRLLDLSLTVSPIKDKQGKIIGVSKIARDISEKKLEETRKNDFIAMVSHELKTPLTSIRSYIQVLLAQAKNENNTFRTNALSRADAQAKKMTAMINDFLSLTRLEEGKISLSFEDFELQPLFAEIAHDAEFLSSSHHFEITGCEDIYLHADRDKIGQVMINLVNNAVKYSPKGSTVHIDCQKADHAVTISVRDEGIGISKEDQQNLFKRFYRVQNEKVKTVSGFGIGLYLVSEILQHHGSKIEVKSEEGKGSTFYFTLPTV